MTRRRDDPREAVETLLRLERLKQEVDGVRISQEERARLDKQRARLRLQRLKQEYESWGGSS